MANVKLIFFGTKPSNTDNSEIICYKNFRDEIFIQLKGKENKEHICLDKSTAIKLAKTLRTEINKIQGGVK